MPDSDGVCVCVFGWFSGSALHCCSAERKKRVILFLPLHWDVK